MRSHPERRIRAGQRRAASLVVLMTTPLLLLGAIVRLGLAVEPQGRPNVVFLYTDDQARWGVGAYGNSEIETPNLDRLAREGARFLNAFTATPVCSPSRAGMFTGRLGTQIGITDWINKSVEPELGLQPSEILWPELLKANGYATALYGKWHLGELPQFHPTRQGYDVFGGFLGGGNRPIDPTLEIEGQERKLEGSLPDLLVDQAIEFIEAKREGSFLVSVHFRAPHAPYAPVPAEDSSPYANLDPTLPEAPGFELPADRVKQLTKEYYGSIHSVDRNVGRLLERLDSLGIAANTVVIFTSDHGYNIGHHGIWHKGNATWIAVGHKGRRPNMFEESIRVPLIVRWPGVVAPGSEVKQVVSNLDTFPSVLDIAGIGTPAHLRIHGQSWVPLIKGESPAWDDTLYGQYDMHHGAIARMRMIRTSEWKLILHFEPDSADELYDLANDPGETKNLAASTDHHAQLVELSKKLGQWMIGVGDPLAAKNFPN